MWTNQPIIFVLLVIALLITLAFGWYVALILVGFLLLLALWSRFRHPRQWKGDGFSVSIQGGRFPWVEYDEEGHKLSLRGEWSATKDSPDLLIVVDEEVYLAPDYKTPLTEARLSQIEARISEGLAHLHVAHAFARLGWASVR